nr:uncharacterized protein LOC125621874 [Caretta caretta]
MGTDGSQEQALSEDHEVTLFLKPVRTGFGTGSAVNSGSTVNPEETEAALEPVLNAGPTYLCGSFQEEVFHKQVMVKVLERTDKQVQYQKQKDIRLENGMPKRQEVRLRLTVQLEVRVSAREQARATQLLEQEWWLREDRAQQRELFERLISIMAGRAPAPPVSLVPVQRSLSPEVARIIPCLGGPCIQAPVSGWTGQLNSMLLSLIPPPVDTCTHSRPPPVLSAWKRGKEERGASGHAVVEGLSCVCTVYCTLFCFGNVPLFLV